MRLSCSRSNEIIIREHLDWIGRLTKQNPEDVIRNHPQIAFQLQKDYDLSYKDNISNKMWKQVLMAFLTSTLVGPHKDLIQIFSPLTDFSSTHFAIDNYQLHSVLGIGSNACVYKTVDGYCLKVVGYSRKDKLKKEYDKLQIKYGAKDLDSIYNGGCETNPDICFVFMNPTAKNIAAYKEWNGLKAPWIGTKNVWGFFQKIGFIEVGRRPGYYVKPKEDAIILRKEWEV